MKKDCAAPSRDAFVFVVAEAVPQTEGDKLEELANIMLLHKMLAPMKDIGKFRAKRNIKFEVV